MEDGQISEGNSTLKCLEAVRGGESCFMAVFQSSKGTETCDGVRIGLLQVNDVRQWDPRKAIELG